MNHFCDQAYLWQMTEKPEDGSDFIVTGDKDKLQPKEAEEEKKEEVKANDSLVMNITLSNVKISIYLG